MPRYLPQINNMSQDAFFDRIEAERQTHSHRIQGGAQGWLQNVMAYLWKALMPYGDTVRFVLQIHDELLFEAREEIHEEVGEIIADGMINHGGAKLRVPVKSSGSWAKAWDRLKD
jgi:DNA polymerase-1